MLVTRLWNIDDALVSLFPHATDPHPDAQWCLRDVLTAIKRGAWQSAVERVYAIYCTRDKDAYRQAKAQLPCFTACGTFSQRGNAYLLQHNGTVHADVDGLDAGAIVTLRESLRTDPTVLYCFLSPSGAGIKYGVRVQIVENDADYKHAWQSVQRTHAERHNIHWDSTTDIARLCFVSYDAQAYLNPYPDVFRVPPKPTPQPVRRYAPSLPGDDLRARVESALAAIPNNVDWTGWRDIGFALHSTGESWAVDLWHQWSAQSSKYDVDATNRDWARFREGGDGRINIGTLFHYAKEAGWRGLPRSVPDMAKPIRRHRSGVYRPALTAEDIAQYKRNRQL